MRGQRDAGVLRAGAGGADHEQVAAAGSLAEGGQGVCEVVEGNVVGARQVPTGVFAGGAYVDHDEGVQTIAHGAGGESGVHGSVLSFGSVRLGQTRVSRSMKAATASST